MQPLRGLRQMATRRWCTCANAGWLACQGTPATAVWVADFRPLRLPLRSGLPLSCPDLPRTLSWHSWTMNDFP